MAGQKEQQHMQLTLGVGLEEALRFENFLSGPNAAVVQLLLEQLQATGFRFVYLWGGEDTGKSHLLQACKHHPGPETAFYDLAAVDVSLAALAAENAAKICIDNIQSVAGQPDWEEALFHLFNRVRDQQGLLVMAGDAPPMHLAIQLADLRSRLSWGLTYQLHRLQDDEKLAALKMRARQRGLDMPDEVARYILHRCPRRLSELFATLERLDEASLTAQRKLTIPFVRKALGW
ncbi:DnaA regulatory inactivator Hda [Marinospirillum alkaliphilum]|uniref:Regulatory inactivation of DnaA Hda protein n=1 Tax=Marinospirillum alkaliphilum DSM 21637 TaxID=1122209 RepID=A0A1K1XNZ4_9GAMM|nr:DnaA regulatory inactivator Hda [Marinospirillum alkaliphilum]SFX51426.1 regulatory inactivation of DnaA Hda protein [Marinospirillum alkaliphilum DSM 21637]